MPPLRHLCEFKVKDAGQLEGMEVGQQIDMTKLFEKDQSVDVAGMTIGKGFQGSIKRWGHKRGPMSHGTCLSCPMPVWTFILGIFSSVRDPKPGNVQFKMLWLSDMAASAHMSISCTPVLRMHALVHQGDT